MIFESSSVSSDGFEKADTGGCVIAFHPAFRHLANFEKHELVPGRCVAASCRFLDKCFTVVNVHNFALSSEQFSRVENFATNLSFEVRANPEDRGAVLIGDLNFKGVWDRTFKAGVPPTTISSHRPEPTYGVTLEKKWKGMLDYWTEISQPFPTHYNPQNHSCNRIDRVWIPGPSSLLLRLSIVSHVIGSPEEYYGQGLSDHAPFTISFGRKTPASNSTPPLPKFVCKHPNFKFNLESLVHDVNMHNLPPRKCLPVYKAKNS